MDLRPSISLRSPLSRLNSNMQRQRDRDHIGTLFSPGGGTTTRASSRKLRALFDDHADDDEKAISAAVFASAGGDDGENDSRTEAVVENPIGVASKPKKKAGRKAASAPKKAKLKPKKRTSIGRWETWERLEFLRGLRRHGKGRWKKIGESIPTRYAPRVHLHVRCDQCFFFDIIVAIGSREVPFARLSDFAMDSSFSRYATQPFAFSFFLTLLLRTICVGQKHNSSQNSCASDDEEAATRGEYLRRTR